MHCIKTLDAKERHDATNQPSPLSWWTYINHFEFPDGDRVLGQALPIAPRIARLKKRARTEGIPVIYVNDNFGQWRSQASELVEYCLGPEARGVKFVEQIKPDKEDYFVLKPMHSAFYQTPLEVLLRYLGATTLILAGLATNSCIILQGPRREHARPWTDRSV